MIPVRVINYPFPNNNLKDLAYRSLQAGYSHLEDEIIENKAIVVIDFNNDPDVNWSYTLENAPEDLVKRFKRKGKGDIIIKTNPED